MTRYSRSASSLGRRHPQCSVRRLNLEPLEERRVLATIVYDFAVNDGGFTTRGRFDGNPWEYTGTDWHSDMFPPAQSVALESLLISPTLPAEDTTVVISIEHQYDFPTSAGGLVETSVNGGPFSLAVPEAGYPVAAVGGFDLTRPGWGGNSGGIVNATITLELNEDDNFQFRFRAGWREFTGGDQWRIHSVTVNTGGDAAAAQVLGRHVLYSNSFFDGDEAAVTAEDDGAIATDKGALMPGETATFANYTSYARGIKAIAVDVSDLASEPTLATMDSFFEFHVGNDDAPEGWALAPTPIDVVVREEAGLDGSDRITVLWEDNAIKNGWLQTTVLANASTGLAEPDVFYFGNAIGDSGNSATDASVNAQDIGGARDNPHNFLNRALIDDAFDYNRDSLVNAQDIGVARDNPTNFLSDLNLITVPAAAPVAAAATPVSSNPASSNIDEEGLPVPLQNLAMMELVSSSSLQDVVDDTPLLAQPRLDNAYWGLDESRDHTNPSSEQSDPPDWGDLLLETDLVDLLAQDGWSWGR